MTVLQSDASHNRYAIDNGAVCDV